MDATLLFPTPYEASVNYSAHLFNLDSSWLYAIIRQESRFFAEAKSQTGAQGLTQLMPATARWAAKRLHLTPLHHEDITQPDTNILLGSYYFSHLQQLLGNPILATIGYNAGPLRAQRWATQPFPDARIFIENIPFDETRDYVSSTFKDWAEETTTHAPKTIEHALAHELKSKTEAAYQRRRHHISNW
jgi:soluble lytic murein transglycosylase